MLFVSADRRGAGIGTELLRYAVAKRGVIWVDVNQQNHAAASSYGRRGFEVVGRSETDEAGRPYPLPHMQLNGQS